MFKKARFFFSKYPFWIFFLLAVIAYLPILLPQFTLKNDMINQNLPTRFVFSEAVRSGYEPFWNPYLNFGTPQYGDMNNGFWNPFQWLIGSIFGYSIYTITFEEFFYIIIGAWGTYKLSKEFVSKQTAILTGIAYMLCGYIVGHLQYLGWITGTAFFPFVLLYFLKSHRYSSFSDLGKFAISVFFFISSTHPGLIIGAIYFFVFLFIFLYSTRKTLSSHYYKPGFWKINLLLAASSILTGWVVITSNLQVLEFISRGSKLTLADTLLHPTTASSYASLLFPLTVNRWEITNSDIGMRNSFIGLTHLLGIACFFIYYSKRQYLAVLPGLLFFFLLASGGWFKYLAWKALPLLGYVRLNGEFRYFFILILLAIGAAGLDRFINEKEFNKSFIKKFKLFLLSIAIIALLISGIGLFVYKDPIGSIDLHLNDKSSLKAFLDHLTWAHLIFFQAGLLLGFLAICRKRQLSATLTIFTGYSLITTLLSLPFTGIGISSKKEIQSVIDKFPPGIMKPDLVAINNAEYITPPDPSVYLLIASFSKKIGYITPDQYPVVLKTQSVFQEDSSLFEFIKRQSYLFLSKDTIIDAQTDFQNENIRVIEFGPGNISCQIHNNGYSWLTLLQNNYPLWEVELDGKKVEAHTGFKTFISIQIPDGTHEVHFRMHTIPIKLNLIISLTSLLTAFSLLAFPIFGKKKLFNGPPA